MLIGEKSISVTVHISDALICIQINSDNCQKYLIIYWKNMAINFAKYIADCISRSIQLSFTFCQPLSGEDIKKLITINLLRLGQLQCIFHYLVLFLYAEK